MKSFIAALVIFVVMIGTGIASLDYIENVSEKMVAKNDEIKKAVSDRDFEKAHTLADELDELVNDKRAILSTTMEHNNIDTIEIYVNELKQYVSEGISADALARCEVIEMLLKHLPKNYKLRIENIF